MIPIGTRVTVTTVHPAGRFSRTDRLIGRTGIVTEHTPDPDCPNLVEGLTRFERILGVWAFNDDELTPHPATTGTETTADPVVMRFLTHGGAAVELRTQTFRQACNSHRDEDGKWVHDWRDAQGFNWRCTGCNTIGKDYGAYDEYKPSESRRDATTTRRTAGPCPR